MTRKSKNAIDRERKTQTHRETMQLIKDLEKAYEVIDSQQRLIIKLRQESDALTVVLRKLCR